MTEKLTKSNNPTLYCRVCGLYQKEPQYLSNGSYGTYHICHCCGVTFGYEDAYIETTKEYRAEWLKNGAKWFEPKEKPENWNLEEQMKNIPKEFL